MRLRREGGEAQRGAGDEHDAPRQAADEGKEFLHGSGVAAPNGMEEGPEGRTRVWWSRNERNFPKRLKPASERRPAVPLLSASSQVWQAPPRQSRASPACGVPPPRASV